MRASGAPKAVAAAAIAVLTRGCAGGAPQRAARFAAKNERVHLGTCTECAKRSARIAPRGRYALAPRS